MFFEFFVKQNKNFDAASDYFISILYIYQLQVYNHVVLGQFYIVLHHVCKNSNFRGRSATHGTLGYGAQHLKKLKISKKFKKQSRKSIFCSFTEK